MIKNGGGGKKRKEYALCSGVVHGRRTENLHWGTLNRNEEGKKREYLLILSSLIALGGERGRSATHKHGV